MIQDTFLQFCMEQGLFDSHQKVLLALSGGLDSMTLVDLLYTYRDQLDINLVLVHINHHQRLEHWPQKRRFPFEWLISLVLFLKVGLENFVMTFSKK